MAGYIVSINLILESHKKFWYKTLQSHAPGSLKNHLITQVSREGQDSKENPVFPQCTDSSVRKFWFGSSSIIELRLRVCPTFIWSNDAGYQYNTVITDSFPSAASFPTSKSTTMVTATYTLHANHLLSTIQFSLRIISNVESNFDSDLSLKRPILEKPVVPTHPER